VKYEKRLGESIMNLSKVKTLITIFLFVFLFVCMTEGTVKAYYGSGLGSSYGMYGGGLYGSYGGYSGLGGIYGGSMYGLGGLMGGMYGGSMYGLGGLYGGMYGGLMGGMYGGLSGLYGAGLGGLGGLSSLRYGLAEQAGTWEGIWTTGITSGPLTINIVEDPVIGGILVGFVQLIGNVVLPTLVDVTGEIVNNQIILTGSGTGLGSQPITIDLVGTLLSPTEIEGNYTLTQSSFSVKETGAFQATLTNPVL
jgi:hypothetical protein